MYGQERLRYGMTVRSSDGDKLGHVAAVGDRSFIVEKGFFFQKDYEVLFEDVREIAADEIILNTGREALHRVGEARSEAAASELSTAAPPVEEPRYTGEERDVTGEPRFAGEAARAGEDNMREETRVPIVEERLEAEKYAEEAGAVHIKKEVEVETQTLQVPVAKERVEVERIDVAEQPLPPGAGATPRESEIVVPIREERVEVTKHPVVTGEVRVKKDTAIEEQRVSDTVRKERVDVKKEGKTKRERPSDRP